MSYSLKDDIDSDVFSFSGGTACFLIRYANNSFPEDYVPSLWDTAGQDDYDRLRPLSYPETNVFLFLFDLTNVDSLNNLREKFYPEIQEHCPNTPIVLVGTKADLLEDMSVIKEMKEQGKAFCSKLEIVRVARDIKAVNYFETSAKTGKNVKETFDECLNVVFQVRWVTKRFLIFKKKIRQQSCGTQQDWEAMEKELKKEETDRIKRYIAEIKDNKKIARKEFKRVYSKLSEDLVLHILHEFVLIDFSDLYEFQKRFLFFLEECSLFQDKVLFHFFGYFGSNQKKIIQVFYNFKVYSREQFKYIPRMRKHLLRKNKSGGFTIWRSTKYYSKRLRYVDLVNVTLTDLKKLPLDSVNNSVKFLRINETASLVRCGKEIEKFKELEVLQVFHSFNNAVPNLQYDIKCDSLKRLVLSYSFPRGLTFKFLKNLEYLKMRNEYTHGSISEKQFKSIAELPSLKELLLYEMTISSNAWQIDRLFDNRKIEKMILHVQFNFFCLKEMKIDPNKSNLKFLAIVFESHHQPKNEVEAFPKSFVSMLKKVEEEKEKHGQSFEYFLKGSKEGKVSSKGSSVVLQDLIFDMN